MGTRAKVNDKQRTRAALAPHVRKAFRDAEEAAMEAMGLDPNAGGDDLGDDDDDGDGHTHIHVHMPGAEGKSAAAADEGDPAALPNPDAPPAGGDVESRIAALEAGQKEILAAIAALAPAAPAAPAPTGDEDPELDDGDKKAMTGDSAALEKTYQSTLALAEVLVPGFRMPTFDAKLPRRKTVDTLCATRRRALDMAYATHDGQTLVNKVHGVADGTQIDLTALDCTEVAGLFKSAAGAKSLLNNRAATGDSSRLPVDPNASRKGTAPTTQRELNAFFAKYYGPQA